MRRAAVGGGVAAGGDWGMEMGSYGIADDEGERQFGSGLRAIRDASDDHGVY